MKKIIFAVVTILLSIVALRAGAPEWKEMPKILKRIAPPKFPKQNFDITQFAAVGDGQTDCTAAIAKAIDVCVAAGGGHVVVPAGNF